ncbi:hypothetical protein RD792_002094 [Penstemon davidsonii]|uniref:Exonuclease domain-containing protein n=1 Tax=Penstemon davidsonii TaxID=160366 RepID=A0ABR0DQ50_9LAMI|nr:hypothetical protein RD792_002094 [Penstemon davidsonii]
MRESTSSKSKIETTDIESDQFFIDLAKHATVICFDIETTGLSKYKDRILEIALQDLRGGENSTFETLVNPQRNVPNERIHGISSLMVNKSDVPRIGSSDKDITASPPRALWHSFDRFSA